MLYLEDDGYYKDLESNISYPVLLDETSEVGSIGIDPHSLKSFSYELDTYKPNMLKMSLIIRHKKRNS